MGTNSKSTHEFMKQVQQETRASVASVRKVMKTRKAIDVKAAEGFLRDNNDSSTAPMVEQMFKNLGNLAPDHNIFNYYKNLAKIEQQRKRWLKRHPPAALHYKRKKPNYVVIQQKKLQTRKSLQPLPWTLDLGRRKSHYQAQILEGHRTASFLEFQYGGKNIPRPWHKYQKIIEHRRILASEQDDFIEFEFTTRERSINTPMSAVLFLHILEIVNVSATAPTLLQSLPICFYCVISIGHVKKSSKITLGRTKKNAKLDFSIHFSLEISSMRNHQSNNLKIEIWCFQDPETQYVIGIAMCHLYEMIKDIHGFKSKPMWVDGIKTGTVCFEYAFAYGALGYGHSNQIKNTAVEIYDVIGNSMFPRVSLFSNEDDEVICTPFETRVPNVLKLMDQESFLQEVVQITPQFINGTYLEGGQKCLPISMKLEKVQFYEGLPIHCKVNNKIYQSSLEADFNDLYGEYIVLRHRRDRLYYLHDLINGPQNDIEETDMGSFLFQEMSQKHYEQVLDADEDSVRHGVTYVYPRVFKCAERDPITLTVEDEEFMAQFPSVRRQSGYLDLLFGYSPLPSPENFINDMDYPLIITKNDNSLWKRLRSEHNYGVRIRRFFRHAWRTIMKWWNHFFPRIVFKEPEISVTTASAPGSVTRIHSYFVNEDKDRHLTEVMRIVQKTTALLALEEVEDEAKKEAEEKGKGVPYANPRDKPLDNKESVCPVPLGKKGTTSLSKNIISKLKSATAKKGSESDLVKK